MKLFALALILMSLLAAPKAQGEAIGRANIDLSIISMIESSGNPMAYNKKSGCIGLYQINPKGALADFNRKHPNSRYSVKDLYDPQINGKIANWYLSVEIPRYLKHFGHPVNTKTILWAYNAGISKVNRNIYPTETEKYYLKYLKLSSL